MSAKADDVDNNNNNYYLIFLFLLSMLLLEFFFIHFHNSLFNRVTKDVSKVFCYHCGNQTLQKVTRFIDLYSSHINFIFNILY